jgi:hypothetical protein
LECIEMKRTVLTIAYIVLGVSLGLAFGVTLGSCNPLKMMGPCYIEVGNLCYDKPDASLPPLTASWQVIDADTGKGIPGAWVSLQWFDARTEGKERPKCMQNVLGRTDSEGWFRSTGENGAWRYDETEIFVPGYEALMQYATPEDDDHAIVAESDFGIQGAQLPGWTKALLSMGYHRDPNTQPTSERYLKRFRTPFTVDETLSYSFLPAGQRRLYVTTRGFPYAVRFAGTQCGRDTPVDIGFNDQEYGNKRVWFESGVEAYRRICDEKWDSAAPSFVSIAVPFNLYSTFRLPWDLGNRGDPRAGALVRANWARLLPDYPFISASEYGRPLTRAERLRVCSAMEPYTHWNVQKKIRSASK